MFVIRREFPFTGPNAPDYLYLTFTPQLPELPMEKLPAFYSDQSQAFHFGREEDAQAIINWMNIPDILEIVEV